MEPSGVAAALMAAGGITEQELAETAEFQGPGARSFSLRRVVGLVQFHDRPQGRWVLTTHLVSSPARVIRFTVGTVLHAVF